MTRLESGAVHVKKEWQSRRGGRRRRAQPRRGAARRAHASRIRRARRSCSRRSTACSSSRCSSTCSRTPRSTRRRRAHRDRVTRARATRSWSRWPIAAPGIPAGSEERVFDKFHRGASERATGRRGARPHDLPRHRHGPRRPHLGRRTAPAAAPRSGSRCRSKGSRRRRGRASEDSRDED